MKTILKTLLLLTVSFLSLLSCKSSQQLPSTETTTTVKDSISRRVETIDTMLVVRPSDTLKLSALLKDLSEKPIVQKSGTTTATIRRVGQSVEIQCIEDELREMLSYQKEFIEHYREILTERKETTIVTKNKVPEWAKPLIWIGGIWLALFVSKRLKLL